MSGVKLGNGHWFRRSELRHGASPLLRLSERLTENRRNVPRFRTIQAAPHKSIQLDGVSVRYGKSQALSDISLRVEPGEIIALIGANGAGKSTLMRAIMRLVPLHAGTIAYDGQPL